MTTTPPPRRCKDCLPASTRPAPHPGPRCATHHRAVRNTRRAAAHGRRVAAVYSITADDYAALLEYQGGRCAICQRATGRTRRLSVDHDHACCNGPTSCGRCVRGLLCRPCNDMLGHLRDDQATAARIVGYLHQPPAKAVLGG